MSDPRSDAVAGELLADAHQRWAQLTINERKAWCAARDLPYDHFGSFSRLSEAEYHYLADALRASAPRQEPPNQAVADAELDAMEEAHTVRVAAPPPEESKP